MTPIEMRIDEQPTMEMKASTDTQGHTFIQNTDINPTSREVMNPKVIHVNTSINSEDQDIVQDKQIGLIDH